MADCEYAIKIFMQEKLPRRQKYEKLETDDDESETIITHPTPKSSSDASSNVLINSNAKVGDLEWVPFNSAQMVSENLEKREKNSYFERLKHILHYTKEVCSDALANLEALIAPMKIKTLLLLFVAYIMFFMLPLIISFKSIAPHLGDSTLSATTKALIGNKVFLNTDESFITLQWHSKTSHGMAMGWWISEKMLNRTFLIDVLYASTAFIEGREENTRHMPRSETDYNVFQFVISQNDNQMELVRPLLGIRGGNDEVRECIMNEIWTGWVGSFDILATKMKNNERHYFIDVSTEFSKGFSLFRTDPNSSNAAENSARSSRFHIRQVKGYPENFQIRVQLLENALGIGQIYEDLFFTFVLLPEKPMPSRITDDAIGYFNIQYTSLGISDIGRIIYGLASKDSSMRMTSEMVDSNVRLINKIDFDRRHVLKYYIDPSVPKIFRSYIKQGVEKWNLAFRTAGLINDDDDDIVRAVLPGDKDFPLDYEAADIRYSSISWSLDLTETFALGPSSVDPRSGEILNSDIVFTNGWLRAWFGDQVYSDLVQMDMGSGHDKSRGKLLVSFSGLKGSYKNDCFQQRLRGSFGGVGASVSKSDGFSVDDEDLVELWGKGLLSVTLHEVGHTLGLRHNFAASSDFPFAKRADVEYILRNGLASSVMDYVPENYPHPDLVKALEAKEKIDLVYMTNIGTYDLMAIFYGYSKIAENAKFVDGPNTIEVPFLDKSVVSWLEQHVKSFATDEDIAAENIDVALFDFSNSPFEYFKEQLQLVGLIRQKLKINSTSELMDITAERRSRLEITLINQVKNSAAHILRLLGGKHFPSKSSKIFLKTVQAEFGVLSQYEIGNMTEALLNIVIDESNYFDDGTGLKRSTNIVGACNGLYTYCYGRSLTPVAAITQNLKLAILKEMLSFSKLAALEYPWVANMHEGEFLSLTRYFRQITNALLGESILDISVDAKTNQTTIEISKQLQEPKLWELQQQYLILMSKISTSNLKKAISDVQYLEDSHGTPTEEVFITSYATSAAKSELLYIIAPLKVLIQQAGTLEGLLAGHVNLLAELLQAL